MIEYLKSDDSIITTSTMSDDGLRIQFDLLNTWLVLRTPEQKISTKEIKTDFVVNMR